LPAEQMESAPQRCANELLIVVRDAVAGADSFCDAQEIYRAAARD
jgi:hypothetical protein